MEKWYRVETNTPLSKPISVFGVEQDEASEISQRFAKRHELMFRNKFGNAMILMSEEFATALSLALPSHSTLKEY